jgi:hypothetical protein
MYILKIEDTEYSLGIEAISSLTSNTSDHLLNAELFSKLAAHPSANVRREVACKDKIDDATAMMLARDRDIGVLRNIARNDCFRKIASESDLRRLIELGDADLCGSIAGNVEGYDNCDSGVISELLVSYPDPSVRLSLAQNYGAPRRILKKLLNDPDPDVRIAALRDS